MFIESPEFKNKKLEIPIVVSLFTDFNCANHCEYCSFRQVKTDDVITVEDCGILTTLNFTDIDIISGNLNSFDFNKIAEYLAENFSDKVINLYVDYKNLTNYNEFKSQITPLFKLKDKFHLLISYQPTLCRGRYTIRNFEPEYLYELEDVLEEIYKDFSDGNLYITTVFNRENINYLSDVIELAQEYNLKVSPRLQVPSGYGIKNPCLNSLEFLNILLDLVNENNKDLIDPYVINTLIGSLQKNFLDAETPCSKCNQLGSLVPGKGFIPNQCKFKYSDLANTVEEKVDFFNAFNESYNSLSSNLERSCFSCLYDGLVSIETKQFANLLNSVSSKLENFYMFK